MDIRAYLAEQGLGEDEIAAIVGNEKTSRAMSAALVKYEEGTSALTAAQREKAEAADFWETRVTPALAAVDTKVATANSEAARYKAYLSSLKEQGYDVPAGLLDGTQQQVTPPRNDGGQFTRADFDKGLAEAGRNTAPSLISLMQLSNEYQDLYGKPYLTAESDFAEAQKQRKSLTDYTREKYGFATKREERTAKAEQERIDAAVAEKYKAKEAELAARYGGNDNIRTPMPSKFDKVEQMAGHKDSWKSQGSRDAARKDRLAKFSNVTVQ